RTAVERDPEDLLFYFAQVLELDYRYLRVAQLGVVRDTDRARWRRRQPWTGRATGLGAPIGGNRIRPGDAFLTALARAECQAAPSSLLSDPWTLPARPVVGDPEIPAVPVHEEGTAK